MFLISCFTGFYVFYKNKMEYIKEKKKAVQMTFNFIEKIQSPEFVIKKDTIFKKTPYEIKLKIIKIKNEIEFDTYLISIYKNNKKLLEIYTWKSF